MTVARSGASHSYPNSAAQSAAAVILSASMTTTKSHDASRAARDRITADHRITATSTEAPVVKAGPPRPKGAHTPHQERARRDGTGRKPAYRRTYLDCFTAHFKVQRRSSCAAKAR